MDMTRRLRHRFILLGTGAVILIVVIVLGALNLAGFYVEGQSIDSVLTYITRHHGAIPARAASDPEGFDYTPEFIYQTRYYWVAFDADGGVDSAAVTHIAAVNLEEACKTAECIREGGKERGHFETGDGMKADEAYYAYMVSHLGDGRTFVVVMDATREMQTLWKFLRYSVLVGLISILCYIALFAYFSKLLVEPFIRNLKSQRRFITNAGHELRTPIAVISANTEVLEMMSGKNEWTEVILKQVKRLSGLVDDMIALAKLEERVTDAFEVTEVDASETMREVIRSLQEPAREAGKTIEADIEDGVHIVADPRMIYSLGNVFVDNAIKYADEGGKISVVLKKGKKRGLTLAVSNPYAAGKEEDYTKFFERFYREDESHSNKKKGYGIGLAIATEICRYLKGHLDAKYAGDTITFIAQLP